MNIHNKSVARIISIAIVVVLTILLTTLGLLINKVTSDRWWEQLRSDETLIANQLAVSLALPLWNFDHSQMDKIMDSAMQNKAVFSIAVTPSGSNERIYGRVRDSGWQIIEADKIVFRKGMLLQERDIFFGSERIGKVTIAVTPKFLEEFLKVNGQLFILILVPFLLILASTLYLALWRLVVMPLKEVESFAVAVSSGKETDLPVLKTHFYGEVENVRQSLTKMVAMLRSRYDELQGEMMMRQASEERFRLLFDGASDAVFVHDQEGKIIDVNKVACGSLGYTRDELLHMSVPDFEVSFQSADLEPLWERICSGQSATVEGMHRRRDLSIFPVEVHIAPFASGDCQLFFAAARDITERKCTEEKLRLSEERFRTIFEESPVGIALFGNQREIIVTNQRYREFLGYSEAEIIELGPTGLLHPDDWEPSIELSNKLRAGQISLFHLEQRYIRKDGQVVWSDTHITALRDHDRQMLYTIGWVLDITDRKQAEQVMRESEARFRTLIENAPLAIGIGRDGVSLYANDKYLKMFGFERLDAIVGRPIADHWSPECRTMIDERGRQRSKGLPVPSEYECIAQRADGSQFPAQIAVTVMDLPDGRATVAFITDLSDRKKLEEQLIQSQKMDSIGRLAGGLAHDFNNLLTPILGYAEMLKKNTPEDSPDRAKFDSIIMAADRASVLTQQLLTFGRKQVLEMKIVDMNNVVTSFYEILRRTVRENIDIRLHLTNDKLGIRADKNQLEQIFMNLVVNSQYAIKDHGIITVETVPVTLDDEFVCQHAVVKVGKYLLLVVTDTGCGMDEETLSHIFEPFFTTKGCEGSGLGLATVYGLVKQHNGFIWVYSEVGKGTVFKLYFPLIEEYPQFTEKAAPEQPVLNAGGRTILLVEDNTMVRKLVFDLLISHGFSVIVGKSPEDALKVSEGKQIDLMVSDVVMPGMNGPDLYQRLLKTHPGLKVLYMSGYTNNIISRYGVLDEGINFIQKPFSSNDMAKKIDMVLNAV